MTIKKGHVMGYKDCRILRVVKVPSDQMWHIYYSKFGRETYDRVSKKEAIEVADNIRELNTDDICND